MRSWRTTKRRRRLWLLLVGAVALGFAAAFFLGKHFFPTLESTNPHAKIHNSVPVEAASPRRVHLYFASRKGRFLHAEERKIQATNTVSAIEAIVSALLEGPEDANLVSTIPAGSKLLHAFITDDGTAYVDFNPELSLLHPGGITAERLTIYAIVNSLVLNLDSVERVQLLLEGKPAPTLAGHLDIRLARTANLLIVR
jgi:spore germination protein GerM